MVAKGNRDGHRWKMSGIDVQEQEKHGREMAYNRYNDGKPPKYYEGAPYPKDQTRPEDSGSRMAKTGVGDIPVNSWLRGGGKGGEAYSGYNKTGANPPRSPATQGSGGRKKSPGFK